MPTFEFTAIDRDGRTREGQLTSDTAATARLSLERKGLVPMRIAAGQSAAKASAKTKDPERPLRLGRKALALLSRQLATLVTVAPVEEALRTLRDQMDSKSQRRVLDVVHAHVVEGQRFSDAMGRARGAFPATYRAMVAAGETSGSLPATLDRLANLLEAQEDVRSKVTTALVYPIVLAVVAISVIIGLMTFVVPKVVDQFNVSGQRLPLLTEMVIAVSNTLLDWGWLIALVLGVMAALSAWALSLHSVRLAFDRFLLGLPLAGRLIRDVEAASLARTLSTLIASGLPVLEALQHASASVRNAVIQAAVKDMARAVSEGAGLSAAMRRTNVFPPLLVYLAANGESGSQLDTMLDRAADYLEREFRTTTSIALSLLEPAIIVIMGGVVCLVILSILLPILQINTMTM
jgi:general secretion pathway protein F